MKKIAPLQDELEVEEEDFKPLTSQEAQAWRKRNPSVSVWRIVLGQVAVGVLVALLAMGLRQARRRLGVDQRKRVRTGENRDRMGRR